MRRIRDVLKHAEQQLGAASATPRLDADLLLRHLLERDRAWMLTHADDVLPAEDEQRYAASIARRRLHEPIQYILGEQEFYGLMLHVSRAVLIPRPETEHLVEAVLTRVRHNRMVRIADVGTGSGAIALALAHTLPLAEIHALDNSAEALAVAESNAQRLALRGRVHFHHSDLLAAVGELRFDCIASNPPYVPAGEVLEPQVRDWEPHSALFAGTAGLDVYQRLLPMAFRQLVPAGLLALEMGAGQREALHALLRRSGTWDAIEFVPDLQGIDRVALARARS